MPEVVLAEGKSPKQLQGLLIALRQNGLGALVSRPSPTQLQALRRTKPALPISRLADGRLLRLAGPLGPKDHYRPVAVVTAGTADVPVAEETRAVLRALGVPTVTAYDVGVAGVHRTLRALRSLERRHPCVYLVCAGREGALPTIVAGAVRAPVIGVPTSIGYGRGGRGEAALSAMLQSCAPVAVVNIDAAVPAALFAVQLARQH